MCPRATETGPGIDFSSRIRKHLAWWGLRSFSSEAAYYEWQRQVIAPEQLQYLAALAQRRQGDDGTKWDQAFYDLAASPDILPVLYSQRFGYYEQVGLAIVQQLRTLPSNSSVLDVGCGVGILTTWYAAVFPDIQFRGIDRSPQSIVAAGRHAADLNVSNVKFSCATLSPDLVLGQFDGIIATQSLFQSEVDPGLPSQSWRTFERAQDAPSLLAAEERTGLGPRLDGILSNLKPQGILWLFEKTAHLGRRVLLQRALMKRGFGLLQKPRYLDYINLGETETEGPLYILSQEKASVVTWDESPHTTTLDGLYRCEGEAAGFIYSRLAGVEQREVWSFRVHGQSLTGIINRVTGGLTLGCIREGTSVRGVIVGGAGDEDAIRGLLVNLKDQASQPGSFDRLWASIWPTELDSGPLKLLPLYENHSPAAQRVWAALAGRQVMQVETSEAEDGRARHIELGTCLGGWVYLYWANTFDQRQLVMMDGVRQSVLADYFAESVKQQQ